MPTGDGLCLHSCSSSVDPDPEVSRLQSAPRWRVAQAERRTLACLITSSLPSWKKSEIDASIDLQSDRSDML